MRSLHLHSIILAAALIAAATLSSCTNEDNAVVENLSDNEVLFTATLAPRGEAQDDGATRAVYSDGKTKWKNGELIHVYYEKDGGGYGTAEAEINAVATDGSATFTATLTGAKDGGQVKLVYPKSIGKDGELKVSNLNNQAGTISDISNKYDAATASATLVVSNNVATVSSPVAMQNRVCICKFSFTGLQPGDDENMYDIYITVTEGGTSMTYKISDVTPATISAVYVAMLPTENADVDFKVEGFYSIGGGVSPDAHKNIYKKSVSGVKLVAGNFYTNASIAVAPGNIQLTGDITSTVTVPAGMTLYLNNANINVTDGPGIKCMGDVTIVIEGTNTVMSTGHAGIQAGNSLTISGSGSLTATGRHYAAGIGTDITGTCGNITISGGFITAIGGHFGAGIGSGQDGHCGAITIYGANTHINATKGTNAPYSIGKGDGNSSCGTITIGTETYSDGIAQSPFTWP